MRLENTNPELLQFWRRRADDVLSVDPSPEVTADVHVGTCLSARWRVLPLRHCSATHYAERRRDAAPESRRLSRFVCWLVPL
jgi:hypothetical protein